MTDTSRLEQPPKRELGSSLPKESAASSSSQAHTQHRPTENTNNERRPSNGQYVDNNMLRKNQQPAPSGRSSGPRLNPFRKGHRGSRSTTPSPLPIEEDDDDEWLLEGTSTNGHVNATVSVGREASTLSKSDTLSPTDETFSAASTSQEPPPPPKRRGSKSRNLAKKTSLLFSRSNGRSNSHDEQPAPGSLHVPQVGRQSSSSSVGSVETGTSRKFSLSRVGSIGSPRRPQFDQQDIQQPQKQQHSAHPPSSYPQRRASSSTQDSSDTSSTQGLPPHPLRHRQSGSHLSASVPALNRHSAPPRAPGLGQAYSRQDSAGVSNRMASWMSNIFSSNDNSYNNSPSSVTSESTQLPPSPLRKPQSVAASFLTGVRNKAVGGMRTLFDSDAQPDQCPDTMWVMGVPHPGWTPDEPEPSLPPTSPTRPTRDEAAVPWQSRLKGSDATQPSPPRQGLSAMFASSFNLAQQAGPSTPPGDANNNARAGKARQELRWPEEFYDDFRSRIWCTYRNQYAPILSLPQHWLLPNPEAYYGAFAQADTSLPSSSQLSTGSHQSRQSNGPWAWARSDERGLTSDSGWGCMLRTGQSMLANALISVHLGRDWRLPVKPKLAAQSPEEQAEVEAYAKYVRILSWFLDDPSPLCPFSVHRMALIGKELGKEVGEWFGPSTASGALKTLANSFPICGLSVATAVDGTIYRSDVYAASNTSSDEWSPSTLAQRDRSRSVTPETWGDKAVLILIGIRLGVDGVNPLYYDSIKALFTFPQSVGIAGGRPSSSYYFVASQANSLFYLDPHFTRAAVPLRVPPSSAAGAAARAGSPQEPSRDTGATPLADESSSTPLSFEQPEVEDVEAAPHRREKSGSTIVTQKAQKGTDSQTHSREPSPPSTPTKSVYTSSAGVHDRDGDPTSSPAPSYSADSHTSLPLDPQTSWYANAYREAELQTFHCDRVKKLPLSGLDPSMLLGFLCHSEAEFEDFCERVAKLPQKIFTVQDELPTWSDDEDGALESVSEPVSGPEMSDDESESSAAELPAVLTADVVDEFGRKTSRPVSPGLTVSRSSTPSDAFSTLRVSQREDFELINTEKPFEPRPEVERTLTARPGDGHSRNQSLDLLSVPVDEEDDIEMLRSESSTFSKDIDEPAPKGSPRSVETASLDSKSVKSMRSAHSLRSDSLRSESAASTPQTRSTEGFENEAEISESAEKQLARSPVKGDVTPVSSS